MVLKKGQIPVSGFKKGNVVAKKTKTIKHRKNISISKINIGAIPVCQYDLEGNFIKEWISATYIQKELGILNSKINMVCRGKRNKTGGFIWRYKSLSVAA